MNENRENTMNEAADALAGTKADEMRDALLEGSADEQDDLFDAAGSDAAETDLFDADPAGDPYEEDDLILVAEPEDGELLNENAAEGYNLSGTNGTGSTGGTNGTGGADSMNGAGGTGGANGATGADNAAGSSGQNSEAAASDSAAGKAADGMGAAADGAAGKDAANTAQPGEEPKYKVQLHGREQELTVPQLVAAAQKGLDYDNMRTQLAAAQQALPALRLVEQYAAANGMTAGQYLQAAGQNIRQQAVNELTQKGVPEQTAKELVAERMRLEEERRAIAPLMQHMNAEAARKKARDPWLAVTREYPDVVNLPESVLMSVQKGETPLAAMRAWELEQLRAKLSAQEMQLSAQAATLKNRQTAPGSAAGAADTRRDPFLDALFSTD